MKAERIHNFDFLRGLFVFLALLQHFTAYLNGWYVWHFDDLGTSPITAFHSQFADTRLATGSFGVFLAWFFSPWVSHIYLALAGFNLAKRSRAEFVSIFPAKAVAFTALFAFFFIENAIVSNSLGGMFSFYPLMAWMVILLLLAVLYRFGGVTAIILLYLFGLSQTILGINPFFDQLEQYLQVNFHSAFEYDARIHYYIHSGALGFLLGYLYFQKEFFDTARNTLSLLFIGVLFISVWLLSGEPFLVDATDVLRYEHMFDRTLTGTCFNQGVQIIVLTTFLYAHKIGIQVPRNVFHWIGIHSLLVFGLHRIFFLKLIAPTRELLGGWLEIPMTAYIYEGTIYCLISIGLSYLLVRSRIPDLILRQGDRTAEEGR